MFHQKCFGQHVLLNVTIFCLNLCCIKGPLATGVVCFSFFFWLDKAEYSAFESKLNSSIVSYRIVSYVPEQKSACFSTDEYEVVNRAASWDT